MGNENARFSRRNFLKGTGVAALAMAGGALVGCSSGNDASASGVSSESTAVDGSSIAWTEELSRYSFLWAVYVGAALAVKRGGHVRITAQFMCLSTKWRLVFRVLGDIIWIAFSLYVAWIGVECIEEGLYYPEVSPTLGIVKAWVESIIPSVSSS